MCFSSKAPQPKQQLYWKTDPKTGQSIPVTGDPGLPQAAIDQGITTSSGYQAYAAQQTSDQQIAAQKAIADQQNTFNQQQLQAIQDLQTQQQQQITDQANRQTTYDAGRAAQLSDATNQINQAFAQFSPDYFNKYAQDYMSQVNDQLGYQRTQANKDMLFGLARHGLSDSQELANATGILDETQGRAVADQTTNAQNAAAQLRASVGQARQSLLGQVQQAQSIGSPIAGSTLGDVNSALNTQQQQISGISSNANDVVSSLQGVPTVSTLGNIFSGVLGGLSAYNSGVQGQLGVTAYNNAVAGLSGTNPNTGSTAGK